MTTVQPINHKRSSSNMDAQLYEPPVKKASFSSLPPSEVYEIPKISSGSKKVFTTAPMGYFLTKCGLISRGQSVFEDIFVNEDKNEYLPYIHNANMNNERMSFSANSLDNSAGMSNSVKAKCISAYCLNETEQHNSVMKKQQQQQLLETRAREESSEFSMICDEEDQIEDGLKCNFLTEQLEPSAQIIIQGCENAQPIVRDFQELINCAGNNENKAQINNNNDEECNYGEFQEGCFELKVIELGNYN